MFPPSQSPQLPDSWVHLELVPPSTLLLTYGALDAVDGLPLRADPLSDVSSGSDGRWWGRGQVFSRRLDVDDPRGWVWVRTGENEAKQEKGAEGKNYMQPPK